MENEVRKAISLEDLDEVTGGFDITPFLERGWDGKCPKCGCSDLVPAPWGLEYECQNRNCRYIISEEYLIGLYRKPGEPWV